MNRYEPAHIIGALAALGHHTFESDFRAPFFPNLNIIGIRSEAAAPGKFDDMVVVIYGRPGDWIAHYFDATTDPGRYYLNNPMSTVGTAILKPGQYRGSHKIGKHKRTYQALVQRGPVTVYRDANRDDVLDMADTQVGQFGINLHRAAESRLSVDVGRWSAGCQVFRCPYAFAAFMGLCRASARKYGEVFTYTLIEENDLL